MKFAKQLETESKDIPTEWRPYLIQYKKLKKLITKVADEIEKHGVSVTMLHNYLDGATYQDSLPLDLTGPVESPNMKAQVQYYFAGDVPNIRPCIRFTYEGSKKEVTELLSNFIGNQKKRTLDSSSNESTMLKPPLEYQQSQNNIDFYSMTMTHTDANKVNTYDDDSELGEIAIINQNDMYEHHRRRTSTAKIIRDLKEMMVDKGEPKIEHNDEVHTVVVELEEDDAFFYMLMTELQNAARHQHKTSDRVEADIDALKKRMVIVASPDQKSDMYVWRHIFSLYMDAQIFQGKVESDRSMRSVQKTKTQMLWFTRQLDEEKLVSKLKNRASKSALQQFMALNAELITIRHCQALNQTAMTKILKKHDKRSGLNASVNFPDFVDFDKFFMPTLTKLLCAAMIENLTTIIPQPDDYACPVCMDVSWKPIRLVCDHVFCVRCLIKAQKKNITSCPMCRHPTAVQTASALNLDASLQRFLLLYFPKEIKQKKIENEREQAIEDFEAITGRSYSPEQLARMARGNNRNCRIM
ncbi:SPX domain-domain-containing protein [Absidia repens]|uniref:SPX domain-domain-containing protein n=1 Tax=Absidia repens TaxID=90262 RepID=A0A1X2IPR4_9FUNG|nr:SPX domain-domain-containing protein [Absidia repens]